MLKKSQRPLYRKRAAYSFFLLEVIISFSLVSILALGIFSLYLTLSTSSNGLEAKLRIAEKEAEQTQYIRQMLASTITPYTALSGAGSAKPFFYTEGINGTPSFYVYMCLDNKVDREPALSNEVLSLFSVSSDGVFSAFIKTHPARFDILSIKERYISLWKNVHHVEWEFALWPEESNKKQFQGGLRAASSSLQEGASCDAPPYRRWTKEWKKEWKHEPPNMFRLTIIERTTSKKHVITSIVPSSIQMISF